MTTASIHRLVEQQAALRGNFPAILQGDRVVSYRDVNYAANALARRLMTSGFRRGRHATVSMPIGIDLAVVLLAVLKAGGSYTWRNDVEAFRQTGRNDVEAFRQTGRNAVKAFRQTGADPSRSVPARAGLSCSTGSSRTEAQYLYLDASAALAEPVTCCPNLPIITRDSDVACILQEADGSPVVMVPHSTVAALRSRAVPHPTPWAGEAGAFDLWIALMAGTTAIVENQGAAVAA